jgi:hypothetical protein
LYDCYELFVFVRMCVCGADDDECLSILSYMCVVCVCV